MFNRKTIDSIDAEIGKLKAEREQLLERRSIILLDIGENPARADVLQAEFNRNDLRLQSIAPTIGKLEGEREALQQKARRKEYDQCMADFKRERALAEKIGQSQRREVIRANVMPGQYMRLVSQQAEIVSSVQQRALDLLRTLDMPPAELNAARDALRFSRLDIAAMDINQHHALVAEMLPEIIAELEQRFGVKLSVEVVNE